HPTAPLIRQYKYFVEQVVPFIERAYPVGTRLENRWLLGFSKSGWGAWSLIARHPELFGRAAAWDAPLEMAKFDRFRAGQVFGSQSHFESYRVIPALQKVDWSAQTVRGPRLILTGYDAFREHHESAHRLLDEQKIPHIYRDGPKRKHIWESGWVEESVELLVRSEHE
ncbi:MAG: hypothetical protein FJ267_19005, partial [Planctomycetes bacterium]|nr:hypothetical protein [Planctomycetota bacterium]